MERSTVMSATRSSLHPTMPQNRILAWVPSSASLSAQILARLLYLLIFKTTSRAFLHVPTARILRRSRSFHCKCDAFCRVIWH